MTFRETCAVAVLSLTAAAPLSFAQQFQVTGDVPTQTLGSGSDALIQINFNPTTQQFSPFTGHVTIRVFDPSASSAVLPIASAGKIVIQGVPSGSNARVDLIVRSDTTFTITATSDFNALIADRGLVNLGSPSDSNDTERGIIFKDANGQVSDDLARVTQFVCAVTGEITGMLRVGSIFRLQAGLAGAMPSGVVTANLTTLQPNNWLSAFGLNFNAIEVITANDLISGSIKATSPFGLNPNVEGAGAYIGKVVVGPSPTARGITGDIEAQWGRIGSIYSTGPVGDPATGGLNIWAADGVDEIRAIDETNPSVPLIRDLYIKVDAAKLNTQYNLGPSFHDQTLGPQLDGSIRLLETAGDLRGVVHVTNLATNPNEVGHRGILVKGDIYAPITVDYIVNYADIIGRSMRGPVVIGKQLHGAIVAYGVPDPQNPGDMAGTIHSVRIGVDAPPGAAAFGALAPILPNVPYSAFKPGLIGSATPPHTMNPADPVATWLTTLGNDGGALDGLIRAEKSIGAIELASMSLQHPTGNKVFRPRIEAPVVQSLRIHNEMEAGSVWSGRLDFVNGQVADAIENNYVTITGVGSEPGVSPLRVGCVGPKADLWIENCEVATIDGNLLGEVHLPRLNFGHNLHIGQRLGDTQDVCGVVPTTSDPGEQSPRGYRTSAGEPTTGLADRAGIFVLEPHGLAGQIIIGREPPFHTDGWKGRVVVGADLVGGTLPTGAVLLSTQASQPLQAPYYNQPSRVAPPTFPDDLIGGGSVGLVPFHLYPTDSRPISDEDGTGVGVSDTFLNGTTTPPVAGGQIELTFRGPIRKKGNGTWTSHIRVQGRPFNVNPECPFHYEARPCSWVDVTAAFSAFGPGAGAPNGRTLIIKARSGYNIAPGVYMVYPAQSDSIQCADVSGTPPPPVAWPPICDFDGAGLRGGYGFVVWSDCNNNQTPDHQECDVTGCTTNCILADYNHSGLVSFEDLFSFLTDFFAGDLAADVNHSGDVTVQDVFDYLAAFLTASGC